MDASVIEVLQQAGSQDPNILKPAEQTLKQWETERGFYTALFNVFSNHSLSVNIRWMAILYFKNGVDRYWRKNAPNAIAEDEKEFLRQRLIANFEEPINQLAVQLAALIAKIARYDCPREWDTLIPTLLDVIRGQNPLAQHRALLTLHHVVKSLASKCLAADRRLFQELTSNVFNFILNLWNTYTESFLIMASNGADSNQIQEVLEKALLLLRILRKLIVHGFLSLSKSQDAILFLEVIFERARTCLECRKTLISRGLQLEVCDKFIIHLTKVLMGVLEMHSCYYIELIPTSLEFCVFYCFTEAGQSLAFERFTIQCLNLIKAMLTHFLRSGRRSNPSDPIQRRDRLVEDPMDRAHQLKQKFFTPEMLTEICSRLVTHYFLLTPSDLELWDTDPENFFVDDGGESWKYSLRPCTVSVFLAFFHQFKEVCASVLVELMQRHHQPVDPNNLHAILLKDAVYNAVGLAAFDLYDEVNFDQWFSTTLKEELKIRSNNYRIIRRRVCWLIGRWTSVKLSAELRPELYELMVEVLSPDEDLGVRLAASDALKLAIDDFQFNPEEFSPYLESAFSLLFSLLKEVKECDTKVHVLYVLSFMIERTGSEINPYVGVLSSYLPTLWQQSEEYNLLRCAIITTLIHLEKALGPGSVILEPLIVGVVAFSCDVNQDDHVYLLEDGLWLWLALLQNAPVATPAIMDLARNMPALLEQSTEHLTLCLYVVQAYIILNPQEFLSQRGAVIVETLRSIMGDLRVDGLLLTLVVFETCMRASPRQGAQLIKPVLINIFERVYKSDDDEIVKTMYLSIVARVLWLHKDIFIQIISELTRKMGGNEEKEEAVLGQIISAWVNQRQMTSRLDRCKLFALALCSLLEANCPPSVLEHFPQIISKIVETLNDITTHDNIEYECIGFAINSLSITEQSSLQQYEDEDYGSEHERRKRRFDISDPVLCTSLKNTLQNQLLTLRRLVGDNQFNQLMSTLNPEIDEQLKCYVSL
ncbi:importin-11 isoform X1 [Colletes gigas]|uniref:importin-11 isoform X1 n=1 Tax=Colletes gigas TaxID=935657 RepID=UPI001C9B803E|nr:importin-11 isoform X1 [Colletes gigas]XP_043263597.1 importin-11 isoform X1 [Colletes gigas]XP_043263599.1 importin-11 isoform X1 [Colletes gigas]